MRTILLILLLMFFSLSIVPQVIFSQTPTPTPSSTQSQDKRLEELKKEIEDLQNKVKDAQGQIRTLSSQITVMNSQIRLTELRINRAKVELLELEQDIEILQSKIVKLESSLDELSAVLLKRIVATYKTGTIEPWQFIVSSSGFSDLLSRIQYARIVQIQSKKLIYDTEQAKIDYTNQKKVLEEKQQRVETLKKQLESYTRELGQQKKDKEALLVETRGDEQTYQQQLARARAEQAAILGIIAGKGEETLVGPIKTGESVGATIVGESACSDGSHLHFEVVKDGVQRDPVSYLKDISLKFEYNTDQGRHFTPTGSWEWPLDEPIQVNQDFGMTYWARVRNYYNGGPHTGLDLFRTNLDHRSQSANVKAVRDGKFYRGSIACRGRTLLYAKVDQGDLQTYYLHIIPK